MDLESTEYLWKWNEKTIQKKLGKLAVTMRVGAVNDRRRELGRQ
jgi:hypothetical protein